MNCQQPLVTPNSNATKLTDTDYVNIRKQYNEGLKVSVIRRMYRIGPARLNKILNNPRYIHGGSIDHIKQSREHRDILNKLKK